jgi:hypothetical protein
VRRISPRRQLRNEEAAPWRMELLAAGACDWCSSNRGLAIHEIARGQNRGLALDKPFACCLLCERCHADIHELPAAHAVCIGLALLRYNRPEAYHLEHYYRLTARRWPSEEMIERYWRRILNGKTQGANP